MSKDSIELNEIVEHLIGLGHEGDYWDFKEEWHDNNADLLHDIICMANNLVNRDAYIIIGVEDKTFNVKGVPQKNKKNQQDLIDFLKGKKFAGSVRPTIYVKTIVVTDKSIDVIIIKNTSTTPYYLMESYSSPKNRGGKSNDCTVRAAHIYTRVGDVNTAKTETADEEKRLYLWKKRFGIDLIPLEKTRFLLKQTKDWLPAGTDGTHSTDVYSCKNTWYNKNNPEFTILYEIDESRFNKGRIDKIEQDLFWMQKLVRPLHNAYIYKIIVKYHSTIMFSTLAVFADGNRFIRTLWKREILFQNTSREYVSYIYIEKDSLAFMLDEWLNNCHETVSGTEMSDFCSSTNPQLKQPEYSGCYNPYNVIPIFETSEEHNNFIDFVKSRKCEFLNRLGDYSSSINDSANNDYIPEANLDYIEYLCKAGEQLVSWLEQWRKNERF